MTAAEPFDAAPSRRAAPDVTIVVMELRELRYFLALAREGNFTRAAARCYVSQQALSRVIASLERRAGAPLVVRRPRGCSLTPAGRRLARAARGVLSRADELAEVVGELRAGGRVDSFDGPFRIGLLLDGLGAATPPVLQAFRAVRPDVPVKIVRVQPDDVFDLLLENGIDAAFLHGPVPSERIAAVPLFDEPRVVALSAASELADAPALRAADLLTLTARARRPSIHPRWEGFFTLSDQRGGEQPRRVGEPVGSLDELLWSIAVDGVFLTLPAHLAGTYSGDRYGVRYVPVPDLPRVPFSLAYRSDNTDPRVRVLREVAAGVAREIHN